MSAVDNKFIKKVGAQIWKTGRIYLKRQYIKAGIWM